MGTKIRKRNLCFNHSKTFPTPTKFYQSSSFYIFYRMPIKKTPNESRTKIRFSGTVDYAGKPRVLTRGLPAGSTSFVLLSGFDPKMRVFTPKPQIRPFSIKTKFIQLPHTFSYILLHQIIP